MAIKIIDLQSTDEDLIDQITDILSQNFASELPEWMNTDEDRRTEVLQTLERNRTSRVLINREQEVMGWIGAIPGDYVWRIRPMAIAPRYQGKGYGRMLVEDVSGLAREQGAVTLSASTIDETGATNLAGKDLYADPLGLLTRLSADLRHPVNFWIGLGFVVVGVMPDAGGPGKPEIHFARRIVDPQADAHP